MGFVFNVCLLFIDSNIFICLRNTRSAELKTLHCDIKIFKETFKQLVTLFSLFPFTLIRFVKEKCLDFSQYPVAKFCSQDIDKHFRDT